VRYWLWGLCKCLPLNVDIRLYSSPLISATVLECDWFSGWKWILSLAHVQYYKTLSASLYHARPVQLRPPAGAIVIVVVIRNCIMMMRFQILHNAHRQLVRGRDAWCLWMGTYHSTDVTSLAVPDFAQNTELSNDRILPDHNFLLCKWHGAGFQNPRSIADCSAHSVRPLSFGSCVLRYARPTSLGGCTLRKAPLPLSWRVAQVCGTFHINNASERQSLHGECFTSGTLQRGGHRGKYWRAVCAQRMDD
jgi:hypothetical protein